MDDHAVRSAELVKRVAQEFLSDPPSLLTDVNRAMYVAAELSNSIRFVPRNKQWIMVEGIEGVLSMFVHHGQPMFCDAIARAMIFYSDSDFDREAAYRLAARAMGGTMKITVYNDTGSISALAELDGADWDMNEWTGPHIFAMTDPNWSIWICEWWGAIDREGARASVYRPCYKDAVHMLITGQLTPAVVDDTLREWVNGTLPDSIQIERYFGDEEPR